MLIWWQGANHESCYHTIIKPRGESKFTSVVWEFKKRFLLKSLMRAFRPLNDAEAVKGGAFRRDLTSNYATELPHEARDRLGFTQDGDSYWNMEAESQPSTSSPVLLQNNWGANF